MRRPRLWITTVAFTLTACSSSTAPIDPSIAPVDGTYVMTKQELACDCTIFTPGDVTSFTSDQFVLTAGTWQRTYSTVTTSPDGTKRPSTGTASGTYDRTGTSIVLRQSGQADLLATFTGTGMRLAEGALILTYEKR